MGCLLAVAFAEPESDPQYLVHTPYTYTHHTAGYVQHPSGAVVPDDTPSVKAAKAQHFHAKAVEYAKKPFVYTYAHTPVVAPTVAYTKPVTYAYPTVARPTVAYHSLFKRDAEADPQVYYNSYNPYVYTHNYATPSVYNYAYPQVYTYTPQVYSHHAKTVTHVTSPYSYVKHFVKRAADAEADPQFYYNTYSPYNYYNYNAYTPYYNTYAHTYGYPSYYNTHAYGYPYVY